MENTKETSPVDKPAAEGENPNPNSASSDPEPEMVTAAAAAATQPPSRTPFTSLSQVDADLALARALQEQERAYMMLRMNGGGEDVSDYESSHSGSYEEEDEEEGEGIDDVDDEEDEFGEGHGSEGYRDDVDAFDANEDDDDDDEDDVGDVDPSAFDSDEAYARALQEAEEQAVASRLMALTGFHDWEPEDAEEHGSNSQDWQEVDPDELSYEELLALGEVVGTQSRGLSADTIASLPSTNYKAQSSQDGGTDQCVICRVDYEEGDALTVLSCKHLYHPGCINNWLQINKVCPVCSTEVTATENRSQ
ncbi:E3 ubiquitin ligase BIG BROTHER-related [Acorus calamus]|uniref:E3 ubiquitin ligase BIG BROTHER-related n=1 Tax=Acorus calamus TaxID=4465 RepID=A0AAV9EEC2_ACOCL|nr:E3 ubiquitin ligase BIG BROTHER-related [Acorus calamus]